jgi:hypothetical protein
MAVKLYHFTRISYFIDTPGEHSWAWDLKPSSNDDWRDILGFVPQPMVWLTRESTPKRAFARPESLWRLTVELGESPRLVRWEDYLLKFLPRAAVLMAEKNPRVAEAFGGIACTYAYFGIISRSRVVAGEDVGVL